MAKQTDKIEHKEQSFYALIQIDFDNIEPVFALGDREMGIGMYIANMYDKKTETVIKECTLHITRQKPILQLPTGDVIDLTEASAHIDAETPCYWFTNDNYD